MSNTIRRNSKAIRSILSGGYTAKTFTLRNNFSGESCSLKSVRECYETFKFCYASSNGGTITIHVHSNEWHELTPEMVLA